MKTLIICESTHRGNTKKIAAAMAEELEAKVVDTSQVQAGELGEYDLVGFGSGIYMGKHDAKLLSLVDRLPFGSRRKAFIFSTSWTGINQMEKNHQLLADKLMSKDYDLVGQFSCKGMATFGLLKYLGGINKNHPDQEEITLSRMFAEGLK